ncbi:winged helix DNA-binding domain-containing protein [Microbacterium sp. P07]|uniref:winged helix DNA-binding domain-containing protein n=1 Tax=Microbacterium sp. P07 TaxID=3366952 RepID=UPI0037465A3E
MNRSATLDRRLRSHRLIAPASTVVDAAEHMLAVQAQEFWGGRWALAVRTRDAPTVTEVDGAFARGELIRAWTMRGTLHITRAADLAGLLAVTAERQVQLAAARHRELGLDVETFARAETLVHATLTGGGRLTRAEFSAMLARGGVDPEGQRGIHVLQMLALRGVVVLGPVVPREGGPGREQYIVLAEEWITDAAPPTDPLADMFARYIASHGPGTARDFAWWSGLPLGVAREAAVAASDRVVASGEQREAHYISTAPAPRRARSAPDVLALPPFEEFYLSYTDRTVSCAPPIAAVVGPAKNGMVRPILLSRGEVVGVWSHSLAVGRHRDEPVPQLLVPGGASDAEVAGAIARYAAFVTG